jgi:glycosyltransferase involved in cell wall biosynthesis
MYDTIEQMHEIVRRRSAHAAIAVRVGASDIWHKSADIRVPSRVPSSRKDGNCLKLIYFGTYVPLHGASVFGDALAECLARGSNIQVTLVGVGSDRKSVEQALAPFSSSVRWIDWLNGPELVRAVANSDLSLGIFSTSRKAALVVPNKAYQSIAAGTPIVTSRTNVQQKMLGRAALYTEAGNARALADLLNQIASDRSAVGAAQMEAMRMRHAFRPQAVATEFLAQLPIKL